MYENAYRDKLIDRQPKITQLAQKLDKAIDKGSKNNVTYICFDSTLIQGEKLKTVSSFVNSGICIYKHYRSFVFGVCLMPIRTYTSSGFSKMGFSTASLIFGANKRVPTNNTYIKDICLSIGLKFGRRFYQEKITQKIESDKYINNYIEGYTHIGATFKVFSIKFRALCGVNYDPLICNVSNNLSAIKPYIQIGIEL